MSDSSSCLRSAIVPNPLVISPDASFREAIAQMHPCRMAEPADSAVASGSGTGSGTEPDRAELDRTELEIKARLHRETKASGVVVVEQQQVVGLLTERDVVRLTVEGVSLDQPVRQVMKPVPMMLRQAELTDDQYSLSVLLQILQRHEIRQIPVVDAEDHLLGLITYDSLLAIALELDAAGSPANLQANPAIAELQKAEVLHRAITDIVPAAVFIYDLTVGSVVFCNPEYERVLGYTLAEIQAMGDEFLQRLYHPDSRAAMEAHDRAIATDRDGSVYDLEYQVCRKDGSMLPVFSREVVLHRDAEGRPRQILGVAVDLTRHRAVETELGRSQQHHKAMLRAIPDIVFRVSREGQYLDFYASDSMVNLVDTDDVVGRYLHDNLPAAIAEADYRDLRQALETQTVQVREQQVTINGKRHYEEVRVAPCGQDEAVFFVRDITERKQAELALAESQHFSQEIANASPNVLYLYDVQEQRNIYTNRQISQLLGYTPEEVQAMGAQRVSNLMHPDDWQRWLDHLNRCSALNDGESIEFEYRMRHADGRWRWFCSRDTPFLRDADGQVQQILGVAEDISDRKQAESDLRASRLYFQSIIADQTELICRFLADGTLTFVNDAYCKFFEKTPAELIGKSFTPLLPEEDKDIPAQYFSRLSPENPVIIYEHRVIAPDGSIRWQQWSDRALFDLDGNITEFQAVGRDITPIKEAEVHLRQTNRELEQATRLKDEFLATMSHELRTPLNAILGMTEALKEQIYGSINVPQMQALQTIERSGAHLLELINDILDVAKIESGRIELHPSLVSVELLCRSSLSLIQQQAFQKKIQLSMDIPAHVPLLLADERRMRQVLINLLTNAVKFTPEDGKISLSVSALAPAQDSQARLEITVRDTGIGIAPDDFEKLFQPFVQIDSALNRRHTGTGLGLTLVKHIVELHNGEVEVTSEVGVGSSFTIRLPYSSDHLLSANTLQDASRMQDAPANEGAREGAREREALPSSQRLYPSNSEVILAKGHLLTSLKILLAEDNEANVRTLSSYLRAKGYQVEIAQNGREAVSIAEAELPDLILMDVQMPEMNGLEAIRQLRQISALQAVPVIVLTALSGVGDRDRCLAAGANDYLSKPIKLRQLIKLIHQHCPAS